tara:strand:+ start:3733 stop:4335 length:603 start_codon:yes stop_codon:yes gene_type:complete
MENVNVLNCEPTIIEASNALSARTATTLIELVDKLGVLVDDSKGSRCYQYQIANPYNKLKSKEDFVTERLNAVLPDLFSLGESCLRHVSWNFTNSPFSEPLGHLGFWVRKHEKGMGTASGSAWERKQTKPLIVATSYVLLSPAFKGGETRLLDSRGGSEAIQTRSALGVTTWGGFTKYKESPVTDGAKYSLLIHYTGTLT